MTAANSFGKRLRERIAAKAASSDLSDFTMAAKLLIVDLNGLASKTLKSRNESSTDQRG